MIGWKVMRYEPATGRIVSGADPRLFFPARPGAEIAMPGQGIWIGLSPGYVVGHYAVHDQNALLSLDFDPAAILCGTLTDREPEITVPRAHIRSLEILPETA